MKGRQRSMAIRTDTNKQGWQKSDFPVACEKCYGENPYMRMLKEDYGQQCRLCFRPFTVFKWKGNRGIYKRTFLCQGCSKQKNLCQVCTLDLQFGLPLQVRDKRCGKNGKKLLDQNFTSLDNNKIKPPLPPGPPPTIKQNPSQKQLLFIPEKDSDAQDDNAPQKQAQQQQQVQQKQAKQQIESHNQQQRKDKVLKEDSKKQQPQQQK